MNVKQEKAREIDSDWPICVLADGCTRKDDVRFECLMGWCIQNDFLEEIFICSTNGGRRCHKGINCVARYGAYVIRPIDGGQLAKAGDAFL